MVDLCTQSESPVLLVYSADGSLSPAKTKANLGRCGGGLDGEL
jgi:hypothetical protein